METINPDSGKVLPGEGACDVSDVDYAAVDVV